ncbi:Rap guanine nucleotide exchange factor 4, partial [Schistosoma bovis]
GYHILIDKLYRLSPEALFRKILQKLPSNRTENELQYVYQELLLVPALSSFSISVKQELCKCLYYEVHENALDIVFYQGDPGISWYIIYHGSVWVHINNQGYICLLNEGDDFGKLSLITDKPRAASILLAENNCHFLKLNKNDFNRILHHQINDNDNQLINKLTDHNYSIIAGTIEYILYHLLENCLNELNDQLQSIINNQLYPSYLYPHTPYNIDQTWQIFFLTYKLFTTNNEILLFLYKYLGCNKPLESIHETSDNNSNDSDNNNNNKDIHDYDQLCLFPNDFLFDIIRVCRVHILLYMALFSWFIYIFNHF